MTKNWSPEVRAALTFALNQCTTAGLGDAAILPLYSVGAELERFDLTLDYETDVRPQLKAARKAIEVELGKRKFVYVTENFVRYLERDQLFGKEVYDAFPAARFDLKEAGSAVACGLNTAAGFHLMRAAEVGLWELGKDRRIPLAQKDAIEFKQWGAIITELETEIQKIQQWPNSTIKEEAHKFYNRLLQEIRAFNDGWRRHIAHVRKSQPPPADEDILALSGHVERFLKTLATKISEGHYTDVIWK